MAISVRDNQVRVNLGTNENQFAYFGARAYVTKEGEQAIITCVDKDGKTVAYVNDGLQGEQGEAGIGINAISINDDARLVIELTDGTEWISEMPVIGERGQDGDTPAFTNATATIVEDGGDPEVSVAVAPVEEESLNYGLDFTFKNIEGKNGADGVTPIKGVDYFDGEDNVYVGSNPPPDAKVWIDPTGEADDAVSKGELDAAVDGVREELAEKVGDVQVNGLSIVTDGVADIPIASQQSGLGLIKAVNNNGLRMLADGTITLVDQNTPMIDARNTDWRAPYNALTMNRIDYAVKSAMCDGKGAEWTEQEKANARKRIGEPRFELIEEIVLESDTSTIARNAEPNGTPYNFRNVCIEMRIPSASANAQITFHVFGHPTDTRTANILGFVYANAIKTSATYGVFASELSGGIFRETRTLSTWNSSQSGAQFPHCNHYVDSRAIQRMSIASASASQLIPSGTNIKIYGVRA